MDLVKTLCSCHAEPENPRQCVISPVCHCTGDYPETWRVEIVNFYNLIKYGVYSLEVSRWTRKWLKAMFYMVWGVSTADTLSMKHIGE